MTAGERVAAVLRALAEGDSGTSIRELAAAAGLSPASASRILADLRGYGLARLTPEGGWAAGAELLRLGMIAAWRDIALVQARPVMRQLVERCGETAVLAVLEREAGTMSFVAIEESEHAFQYEVPPGATRPLHTGASGQAILAFLPEEQREAIIARGLPALTEHTVTDVGALRAQLASIRERGFARTHGERVREAVGTAAPIRQADGSIYGSLTVTVPEGRFDPARADELASEVCAAARLLSEALGYSGDQRTARAS